MIDLSIVIPTCNRAALLASCLKSIRAGVACNYEIIVVDGASTDATGQVLDNDRPRLTVICETAREGFVRAANKGFSRAQGRYVMWLNDDARPLAGALDQAVEQLDFAPRNVGLLACFHRTPTLRNIAYQAQRHGEEFKVLHIRGTLYANFGIGRRDTFRKLNYFDERYYLNAADPDFSLKVWHAGLRVVPAWSTLIDHDEHADDRRAADSERARDDNAALFAKWQLPPRNQYVNDFDPLSPCTLQGLAEPIAAAAA